MKKLYYILRYIIARLDFRDPGRSKYYSGSIRLNDKNETIRRRVDAYDDRKAHGFDESELWYLNETLILYLIPRLEAFLKHFRRENCVIVCGADTITSDKVQELLNALIDYKKLNIDCTLDCSRRDVDDVEHMYETIKRLSWILFHLDY